MVWVVLAVVFRTGSSSGKPLLLPVLKKSPPGPTKPPPGPPKPPEPLGIHRKILVALVVLVVLMVVLVVLAVVFLVPVAVVACHYFCPF